MSSSEGEGCHRLQRRVGPMGRVLRTARAIHKLPKIFLLEAPKPPITGLASIDVWDITLCSRRTR